MSFEIENYLWWGLNVSALYPFLSEIIILSVLYEGMSRQADNFCSKLQGFNLNLEDYDFAV